MKKTLLMAGALLALTVGVASAQQGVNLSWNDCGTAGLLQKNFACNSNTAAGHTMVGSAIIGTDVPQLNGQFSVLDMQTNTLALGNWWQFNSGGCRFNSPSYMSADFNFTTASGACLDPWGGGAAGGNSYTPGFNGPNRARIRNQCAIPGSTSITGTDEYYIFKVFISNAKTVGACNGGCSDGVCIVLNSVLVTQPLGQGNYTASGPITRNYVQFQGGGGLGGECPGATPTTTRTWGSVKSLYR
jgi:hypothetical protein